MKYIVNIDEYFDLEKTLNCGQCFHFHKIDENVYKVWGKNSICHIEQKSNQLYIDTNNLKYWIDYFDLDTDYKKIFDYLTEHCTKNNDQYSLRALSAGKGIHILRQPLFETCCSYIISQRNSIPRIQKTIFAISENFSSSSCNCFPSADDFIRLRISDLSCIPLGYRRDYLVNFYNNWNLIKTNLEKNYEEDFKTLCKIKGIGPKVANCICLYGLNYLDAFPIDVWIGRIIKQEYTDKGKELILPEKYAGILQQCMFYYERK